MADSENPWYNIFRKKKVKAVADYVAEDNDADGVARFIEQMILQGMSV